MTSRLVRSLGVPLAIFAAATTVVLVTAAGAGKGPFRTSTWHHGDPGLYLAIAREGYTMGLCQGTSSWCGNAGWFPAYPWLIRAVHEIGVPYEPAALALTWIFAAATLILLWSTFLEQRLDLVALLVLLYCAFAPGMIWGYAMYPLSMLAFFTILCIWLLTRERWLAAGLAGAAAVLAYPLGFAGPVAAAAWLLVCFRELPMRERLRRIALAVVPGILAVGLLFLVTQLQAGHWDGYFLVQKSYGHRPRFPLEPVARAIWSVHGDPPFFSLRNMPSLQTLLVTAVLLCVAVDVARRGDRARWEILVVFWAVAAWFVPVATTHQALNRGEAALIPLAILVGRLPRAVAIPLVAAAILLVVPVQVAYYHEIMG